MNPYRSMTFAATLLALSSGGALAKSAFATADEATVHAHGANEKMIGRNLIDLKDVDGKPFVKERVELGEAKANFWQDYTFTNPVSRKIEPKSMYCERLQQTVVCGGVYKN